MLDRVPSLSPARHSGSELSTRPSRLRTTFAKFLSVGSVIALRALDLVEVGPDASDGANREEPSYFLGGDPSGTRLWSLVGLHSVPGLGESPLACDGSTIPT